MSLSPYFGITTPRFRILSADLSTIERTLYLPIPTKEGLALSWDEKGSQIVELADGSKRKKVKGYSPKVRLKYAFYNDLQAENSMEIGISDGQMPTAEDLLTIMSTYGQARLEFSPSLYDPFFRCLISKAPTLDPVSNLAFKNYEIEIVGRDLFPVCDLGTAGAPGVNVPVQPIPGIPGPQGIKGDPGTILNGTGAPAVGLGANGDTYLDNGSGSLYQKAAGVWTIKTSLIGPQGIQGVQGIQGPVGAVNSLTATSPLVNTGTAADPILSLPVASISVNGYLSSGDWNTFSSKQSALGYVPANKIGDTFTGRVIINTTNAEAFSLKGGSDHVYMGFYARSATPTVRSSYIGFDSAASTVFTLVNELSGGNISLSPGSGGKVIVSGGLTATSLDYTGTLSLGSTNATAINLGTATSAQTINIGTGSGTTTINIGGAGDTVNVAGTLAYINTTNLTVTDKLVTLNKGGLASTADGSGIEVEENGNPTSYLKVGNSRGSWIVGVPAKSGTLMLTPANTAFSAEVFGGNPTANRTATLPDASGTLWLKDTALTATTGTFTGNLSAVNGSFSGIGAFGSASTAYTALLKLQTAGSSAWWLGIGDASGSNFGINCDFGTVTISKGTGTITTPGGFAGTGGVFNGLALAAGANRIGIDAAGGGRIATMGPNASTFGAFTICQYSSDLSQYREALTINTAGAATFSGIVSTPSDMRLSGGPNVANMQWMNGVSRRIQLMLTGAESTANAGSNLSVYTYDDSNVYIDNPLNIPRAAGGTITFASGRPVAMGTLYATAGNFNAAISATSLLTVNGAINTQKNILFSTAGVSRWSMFTGNNETGTNAGSDYYLAAYTDAGTFIDYPVNIIRKAAGAITFGSGRPVSMGDLSTTTLKISSNNALYYNATSGHVLKGFAGTSSDITILNASNATVMSVPTGTVNATFAGTVSGTSFNSITGLSSASPLMDGTATVGTSTLAAREGHVHPSDTSKASLAVANTYTKAQTVSQVTLTAGATVAVDASLSNSFLLSIGANSTFTLSNPTNLVAGQTIVITLKQDATGSRLITWGAAYKFPTGANKVLSTAANSVDVVSCYYDGVALYCGLNKAYA